MLYAVIFAQLKGLVEASSKQNKIDSCQELAKLQSSLLSPTLTASEGERKEGNEHAWAGTPEGKMGEEMHVEVRLAARTMTEKIYP